MRAYLLGYNHGTNDGYFSTLIEQGGCEKAYDESLDVEYVAVDEVLEIIDQMDKEAVEDFELDTDYGLAVVHDRFAKARKKIKALKGGDEDGKRL